MELIVDARPFSTPKPAGVARYVASVSEQLQRLGYKLILVSNKKIYLPDSIDKKRCEIREYTFFGFIPGTLFIMLIFPLIARKFRKIVFWGGSFTVPLFDFKSIVTIHDLVPYEYPQTVTLETYIFGRLSINLSLKTADIVTTVSKFTTDRIKIVFPNFDSSKIVIIRCAVNKDVFYELKDKIVIHNRIKSIVDNNFILAVGSIEPRKNLESLILAFYRLKNSGYSGDLVLVGGGEWKSNHLHKIINQSVYSSSVKFTGFIDDDLLNYFYNGCDLFVFPALYEGFGIPPLEALLAKAKVICSVNTELPNIINYRDAVTWFDPQSDDLYELIGSSIEKQLMSIDERVIDLPNWRQSAMLLEQQISKLKSDYHL